MADKQSPVREAGQGPDLRQVVMDALQVPPTSRWFEVRFAEGEPVTVTCQYEPTEQLVLPRAPDDNDDDPPLSKNYGGLNG